MAVERVSGGSSLIDVLDRVLDKGIVIDAWVRISLVGIDLITVEARVVVASIDTYLKYADAVGLTGLVSRPQLAEETEPAVVETTRRVSRVPARCRIGSPVTADVGDPWAWLRRKCVQLLRPRNREPSPRAPRVVRSRAALRLLSAERTDEIFPVLLEEIVALGFPRAAALTVDFESGEVAPPPP